MSVELEIQLFRDALKNQFLIFKKILSYLVAAGIGYPPSLAVWRNQEKLFDVTKVD